ncbi:choice-of-anchor A family protein [Ruminococcus sp.]|uniref:choice-of-anchor A family protein n=1 Tax=Ruminococcus sp. TaxID=41978 RepID=UPI003FD83942
MKAITRTVAGVTAAAIAVTSSIAAVNADNDKYTKPYTIANVLTDYQFFVEGNFEHGGHTVGAVAIGGSAKIGAFGDGQVAPSYIHHIESVGNFSDCGWVDEAYKAHNVYYGESDVGERTNFVKNDDFIDFTEAMSRIRKESQWIADKGTKIGEDCYDVSSKTITVDLKANSSKSYTIDYSLFSEARTLNFTGLTVAEFAKGGYMLSVVGVNGEAGIDFTSWGSNGTRINLNGQGLDGKLKDLEGGINGGQYNVTGTPLLYNFPDATKLDINYLAGGLCAPNATVSIQGGNYEGNVIAGSVSKMNAEAHFFSYYPITEQGDTTYPAIDGDQSGSSSTTTTTSVSASKPASSNSTTTSNSSVTTTSAKADEKPDSSTSTSASGSDAISTSSSDAAATTTSSDVGGVSDTKAADDPAQTGSASESGSVSSSSQTGTSAAEGTDAAAASTTTKKTADGSTGTGSTTKKTAADAESAKKSRAVDGASAANPKTGAAATTAAAVLLAAASVIAASKKNKD